MPKPVGHRRIIRLKARDWLILAVLVLLVLNIVQFLTNRLSATPDTNIRSSLNTELRQEIAKAHSASTQISLLGTSSTQRNVSQTRQHLYALQMLNKLTAALLGGGQTPLPPEQIDAALTAITDCETQMQYGYGMEVPLDALARAINALSQSLQSFE
ncbi:MAG: hypothetical protein LBN04_09360 [Oscillospiraceae bacterium]|jgi:hypothetical protein|nr:hypothetical protein [Oscillospiraceae bacterium]